jgi:hypothetical protein
LPTVRISWRGTDFANVIGVIEPIANPDHRMTWPLLGRYDFMQHFSVQFLWHQNPPVFYVKPIAPSKGGARAKGTGKAKR